MTTTLRDPAIPYLDHALDVAVAQPALARQLGEVSVESARLTRHKPGRRALIEYDAMTRAGPLTIIGKIRAKGLDVRTYATMRAAQQSGLPVPEPLGLVPEFQMLLQRKEPGVPMTELLAGPDGDHLARRAAAVAHQLHRAGIPTERRHTLSDEVRILHERLAIVVEQYPEWEQRLARILAAAEQLAGTIPAPVEGITGIHRDFYADQILVDSDRLFLLDFDLYCAGDPALDIGNFAAHIIEQSLREHGNADALSSRVHALVERYLALALAGDGQRHAVEAYTTLSLVRHIWISTCIEDRRHMTDTLIDLCEQRLCPELNGRRPDSSHVRSVPSPDASVTVP